MSFLDNFTPKQLWFTADLHLWHQSMMSERFNLQSRRSRWSDVETMNDDLTREWRQTVGAHDVIYHVGDLFHRCGKQKVLDVLHDLSGHWILLSPGNHDEKLLGKLHRQGELPDNVKLLPKGPVMLDIPIHGHPVFLSHYPPSLCPEFQDLPKDAIFLHGHSHGQGQQQHPNRALDVGWDVHERILSFDDLVAHFRERQN